MSKIENPVLDKLIFHSAVQGLELFVLCSVVELQSEFDLLS